MSRAVTYTSVRAERSCERRQRQQPTACGSLRDRGAGHHIETKPFVGYRSITENDPRLYTSVSTRNVICECDGRSMCKKLHCKECTSKADSNDNEVINKNITRYEIHITYYGNTVKIIRY